MSYEIKTDSRLSKAESAKAERNLILVAIGVLVTFLMNDGI